jgi:hypothetical protein
MKLQKYKEVMLLSKEKAEEAKAPFRVQEMKKRGELQQLEIESDIATQEQYIHTLCSRYPIDYSNLVEAIDNLELLKHRHTRLSHVIAQMFADDAPTGKKAA